MALRQLIKIEKPDEEYAVGDIINKGPKSLQTLRFCQEMNIKAVRGNHEDKFIRYHLHERERLQTGKKNPMKLSKTEKQLYESLNEEDIAYLLSLPIYLSVGTITILHAGVLPKTDLENLDKKDAAQVMRVRYVDENGNFVHLDISDPSEHFWWSELYDGRYGTIVYGHQPFLTPRLDRFSIGIDTGAVYGNTLTAVVFDQKFLPCRFEFFQVPSKRYAQKKKPWIVSDL